MLLLQIAIKALVSNFIRIYNIVSYEVQVISLYVTGAVDAVLGPEHQKEIIRYIYNHQVFLSINSVTHQLNSAN